MACSYLIQVITLQPANKGMGVAQFIIHGEIQNFTIIVMKRFVQNPAKSFVLKKTTSAKRMLLFSTFSIDWIG